MTVDAVIDTGFSGFLIIPGDFVPRLGLAYYGPVIGVQADGRSQTAPGWVAEVEWLTGPVRCVAAETGLREWVIGTGLLDGHLLEIDFGPAKRVEVR